MKYVPSAKFVQPGAGMFCWVDLGVEDSSALVGKLVDMKVLVVPGSEFMVDKQKTGYVRCSFSTVSDDDMKLALER